SGNKIGRVDSDGTVRDRSGNRVGEIKSDGTVCDSSGNSVGSAGGIKKEWASVIFFFGLM
ncbi:MAG: hypothetical protein IK092_05755, partial [Muribaculaceae bacterium]|nr:hypothetical protein [Muribaculaceae bacterium]